MLSCPETVRNASRPKKSYAKSTRPSGVRGRLARSNVETRNNVPAPLRVGGGDDRRVDPENAVLVKELDVLVFTTFAGMPDREDRDFLGCLIDRVIDEVAVSGRHKFADAFDILGTA